MVGEDKIPLIYYKGAKGYLEFLFPLFYPAEETHNPTGTVSGTVRF